MVNRSSEKGLSPRKKSRVGRFYWHIKHRGEAADQEWNEYAKKGYKIAAADARGTAAFEY